MTSAGLMFESSGIVEWHGRIVIAGTAFGDSPPDGQIWVGAPGR
jgi:hypothetical protein